MYEAADFLVFVQVAYFVLLSSGFSIVTASRSVDLQARTQEIRDTWVQGLRLLISTLALLPQARGAPLSAARNGWNAQ